MRDYFVILDKHKWLIIATLVVTLSLTALYLERQVPVYQAQANIIVEPRQVQEMVFPQSVQVLTTDWLDLDTQIEVIKMTPVLSLAARRSGLTNAPEGTPEFSAAVGQIRGSIKVKLVEDTKIVNIVARHCVPEKAQSIANAVAQAYIDQDRLSRLESGRDAIRWLSTQLVDLKEKLRSSEEALQRFKEREIMVTLDDKRSESIEEMSKLNASYVAARTKRLQIQAIISEIENQKSKTQNSKLKTQNIPIALLDSPTLQKLGTELGRLQTELVGKRELFKDTYPGVIELKNRIQVTEQKILAELRREQSFLQAQENSFSDHQETERREALKLSKKELQFLALEREVITNREIYNTILARIKELSLAGEGDLNNIRIVEPAELPKERMGDRRFTLTLSIVLGLVLGIGFSFFLESLENTIRTPDDVAQYLGLPVLGTVPRFVEAKRAKAPPTTLGDSKSAPAEAYRGISTNLLFGDMRRETRDKRQGGAKSQVPNLKSVRRDSQSTILVTSAGPKEGKSITTANLGIALAESGQRVLLVDADLRRPILHRVFKADRCNGLSTVLTGELALTEAIVETDVPNLSVLTSGTMPPNPAQVLGTSQMKGLVDQIQEMYDIVIFDSAPVLGMTDTALLATEIDGVVLVIEAGRSTRKALRTAVAQLEQVGAQVFGVVLNNVDVRRDRCCDYYYYYYYYSRYGDEEGKAGKPESQKPRKPGSWKARNPESRRSGALD